MQMRDKLNMQAQNKPVTPLDDRTGTKEESRNDKQNDEYR